MPWLSALEANASATFGTIQLFCIIVAGSHFTSTPSLGAESFKNVKLFLIKPEHFVVSNLVSLLNKSFDVSHCDNCATALLWAFHVSKLVGVDKTLNMLVGAVSAKPVTTIELESICT